MAPPPPRRTLAEGWTPGTAPIALWRKMLAQFTSSPSPGGRERGAGLRLVGGEEGGLDPIP